jgi:glycerol-3-phosphate acyltransferase PlsY
VPAAARVIVRRVGGWSDGEDMTGTGLTLPVLLSAGLGYLLGSIPFGLILTRFAGLGDIRAIGSGNIGATNVLRTGNKGLAALTLVLDALKGTAAVYLCARLIGAPHGAAILSGLVGGLAAFIGHCFPVWLGFRGGKGVATYIGVLIGLEWRMALIFCGVWILTAIVTRYSSASALAASMLTPLVAWLTGHPPVAIVAGVMSLLLIWRHRANIDRLLKGEEPRIGVKGRA